jgi:hypothetical protein
MGHEVFERKESNAINLDGSSSSLQSRPITNSPALPASRPQPHRHNRVKISNPNARNAPHVVADFLLPCGAFFLAVFKALGLCELLQPYFLRRLAIFVVRYIR